MKVLVTGHNGFIGSVMVKKLQEAGHDVTGFDTDYFCGGSMGEYHPIPSLHWDIRDIVLDDLDGYDALIHLAALSNDQMGDIETNVTYSINWEASLSLAILAKKMGIKRFLFASSCSMYGEGDGDNMLTEESPLAPITTYAKCKVDAERDIALLADDNFTPVFLRNATAYGFSPHLRTDLVVNTMMAHAFTTGKIKIIGSGNAWRPLVHVEDIAQAFLLALEAPKELVHNQPINVGFSDENYRVKIVADIVHRLTGAEVEYVDQDKPDPRNYRVSFDKIRRLFPQFSPNWDVYCGASNLKDAFEKYGITAEDATGRKFVRLKQLRHLLDNKMVDESLRWK